jgi:hypothetical protein
MPLMDKALVQSLVLKKKKKVPFHIQTSKKKDLLYLFVVAPSFLTRYNPIGYQ